MENYLETAFTPAVRALQQRKGSRDIYDPGSVAPDALRTDEIEHITNRDSFYLATVSESGWPYVQHRGGDVGFVTVLGPTSIGWIERTGNRQYLGSGNITADDRISAIFVDYPSRIRLKIRGRATHHAEPTRELVEALGGEALRNDGAITVEVIATDWNCPKYITPRYTAEQVTAAIEPLQARIDQLEAQLNARPHKETP